MTIDLSPRRLPVWAPDDETGAAPAEAAAAAPADGAPAAEADTAAPPPAEPAAASADGAGANRWWEDKRFGDDERRTIEATGLTTEDPLDALRELARREIAAKKRLGGRPDDLIPKPSEGQAAAEWRREHAEALGIPATGADYEIPRPEGWPENVPWDDKLEGELRAVAEKHAADPAMVQDITALYANRTMAMAQEVDDQLARAQEDLRSQLERDWGDSFDAKLALSQRAMAGMAEAAGLNQADIDEMVGMMEKKTAPANIVRMFSAIGERMGEDTLAASGSPASLGTTPAEARAKIAEMRSPDGAYFKAVAANDKREIARLEPILDDLYKRAAR